MQKPTRKQGRYTRDGVTLPRVPDLSAVPGVTLVARSASLLSIEHIALAYARAFARDAGAAFRTITLNRGASEKVQKPTRTQGRYAQH